MKKVKDIYQQYAYYFPLAIAFSLPFGINSSILVVLWGLCFFMFENLKESFKNIFLNKWSYVLLGFFVLHAIGYFFSINKAEALTVIERKLSFLAFPILIFCNDRITAQTKKITLAFVTGTIAAAIFCILRAVYLFFFKDTNAFFYGEFNYFMHPSYFAMYLTFSQLVIILFGREWLSHWSNLNSKLAILSAIIVIAIFLCSSKLGLLAAALLLPLTLIVILFNKGFKKSIVALILGIIIIIPVTYKLFPYPFARLTKAFEVTTSEQEINKSETDGTAVRILIWEESVNIIKENFLFGVSPGDENDVLCKAYSSHQLTGALEKQLNTHNQFLQTFLGTGLIGFVLLCIMTFGALITGFMKKNYLLVLFSALSILNFLVESMLQSQSGFMFFALFICLLVSRGVFRFSNLNQNG